MTGKVLLAVLALLLPAVSVQADDAVRGQIVARDHVVLSSQLNTVVGALRVREGESFDAGADRKRHV